MLACYITGCIGTPIHELSHAFFCLIFAHKINEIKLFQINSADGTLGYVNHSYNPKNIYQRIGSFFIGVAPIIGISAILYLASCLLLPSFSSRIIEISNDFSLMNFGNILKGIFAAITTFFSLAFTWQWWIFLLIGLFLSLHMTLSGADIKGALGGLVFVLTAFLIVDIILESVSHKALTSFTKSLMQVSSYLLCFLILALFISVIALTISFVYRKLKRK